MLLGSIAEMESRRCSWRALPPHSSVLCCWRHGVFGINVRHQRSLLHVSVASKGLTRIWIGAGVEGRGWYRHTGRRMFRDLH